MLASKILSLDRRFQELPIYKFYKWDQVMLLSGARQVCQLERLRCEPVLHLRKSDSPFGVGGRRAATHKTPEPTYEPHWGCRRGGCLSPTPPF